MKKSKNALLLTLGHNSSAIWTNGDVVFGYETERLTGIKGDSSFPWLPICEILKHISLVEASLSDIYISDWFCTESYSEKHDFGINIPKYFSKTQMDKVTQLFCGNVHKLSDSFTHHDAHAYSALNFYGKDDYEGHILVCDGFGTTTNDGTEVLSLYERKNGKLNLVYRDRNLTRSLGLFYQYATSACGMRENRDEYKLLGYESKIASLYTNNDNECVRSLSEINETIGLIYDHFVGKNEIIAPKEYHTFADSLNGLKNAWHYILNSFTKYVSGDTKRIIIGYIAQSVIEKVILQYIRRFNIENLLVAGGVFYNVKLNRAIYDNVHGPICLFTPLAGDQGAATGFYLYDTGEYVPVYKEGLRIGYFEKHNNSQNKYASEFIQSKIKKYVNSSVDLEQLGLNNESLCINICKFSEMNRPTLEGIADLIAKGNIVNIVKGDMEFGPRALCNRSTLFNPIHKIGEAVNLLNGRNEVMPFAPVMLRSQADWLFHDSDLQKSDNYMICSHTYTKHVELDKYSAAMLNLPFTCDFTGRPQIIEEKDCPHYDAHMKIILEYLKREYDISMIVNTSFNAHGNPIVFSFKDAIDNFIVQLRNYKMSYLKDYGIGLPYLFLFI